MTPRLRLCGRSLRDVLRSRVAIDGAGKIAAHDTRTRRKAASLALTTYVVLARLAGSSESWPQHPQSDSVKSPLVLVVGCAAPSSDAHIWILSYAGERTRSAAPGISAAESKDLTRRPIGRDTYHLIGVADFVGSEASRKIGERGKIFSPSRVNVTGMLVSGHKVAVKGLYIDARPPRINLTSVVDLGGACP